MRFYDNQDSLVSAWNANSTTTAVPARAKTGPVSLVNSSGTLSNSILFNVGACTINSCGAGQQSCSDGACRATGQCAVVAPMCKYQWTFSTGSLVRAASSVGPHVIVQPFCRN